MIIKDRRKEIFTIPNMLSLFRLVLIPVYVLIYVNARQETDYYIAAGILTISCLTDMLDGKIARHFNMITSIGKILDPLADKATQFSLIVCLALKHRILRYLIVLFIIKEGFQAIAGGIKLRRGKMLKGALFTGKLCTTVLFISLIIMVMIPELPSTVVNIIVMIDSTFMISAFVDYIIAYFFADSKFQAIDE